MIFKNLFQKKKVIPNNSIPVETPDSRNKGVSDTELLSAQKVGKILMSGISIDQLIIFLMCRFSPLDIVFLIDHIGVTPPGFRKGNTPPMQAARILADAIQRHPDISVALAGFIGSLSDQNVNTLDKDSPHKNTHKVADLLYYSLLDWDGQGKNVFITTVDMLQKTAKDIDKSIVAERNDIQEKSALIERNVFLESAIIREHSRIGGIEQEKHALKEKINACEAKKAEAVKLAAEEKQKALNVQSNSYESKIVLISKDMEKTKAQNDSLSQELAAVNKKLHRVGSLKRVGLFVDEINLAIGAREMFGKDVLIDYAKLLKKVSAGDDRVIAKAVAYIVESENAGISVPLLTKHLVACGYEVRVKPIIFGKANWDLGMGLEIMDSIARLDIVILGSGDGDFIDLIEYAKTKFPEVLFESVIYPRWAGASKKLLQSVSYVHYITQSEIRAKNGA